MERSSPSYSEQQKGSTEDGKDGQGGQHHQRPNKEKMMVMIWIITKMMMRVGKGTNRKHVAPFH